MNFSLAFPSWRPLTESRETQDSFDNGLLVAANVERAGSPNGSIHAGNIIRFAPFRGDIV
jgi:hypothetical protein